MNLQEEIELNNYQIMSDILEDQQLKFKEYSDAVIYSMENGFDGFDLDLLLAESYSLKELTSKINEAKSIGEFKNTIEKRAERKLKKKNKQLSIIAKKGWKNPDKRVEKLRKTLASSAHKVQRENLERLHQKLIKFKGRQVLNKGKIHRSRLFEGYNKGSLSFYNINEWFMPLSGIVTKFAIEARYSMSESAEVDNEVNLAVVFNRINPILTKIANGNYRTATHFFEDLVSLEVEEILTSLLVGSQLNKVSQSLIEEGVTASFKVSGLPPSIANELIIEDLVADSDSNAKEVEDNAKIASENGEVSKVVDEPETQEVETEILKEYLKSNTTVPIVESWNTVIEGNDYTLMTEANDPDVDGTHIIAKVVGAAFFPDVLSQNLRMYPRKAWDNALARHEFNEALNDKMIYGSVGHDQEINDKALREDKLSHIVNKIWIDENNVGQAEYLILGSKSGKAIHRLMSAGSKIRVSTRARGIYENYTTNDGHKIVNANKFYLQGIDFVTDAGFPEASPNLV